MDTRSKYKLSKNTMVTQALRQGHSHRLSSPLAFCKAQGIQPSKATPLCTSAALDSQAGRQGEGPIWGPAVRVLGFGKAGGLAAGRRCLRAVCGLPWRYCLTVFTTSQ
ncbi:hypothetical protein CgunFtcFv8_016197 [Champsocephalus gunnari]|uniref:Uncharacterized protein n=1 Tax=Champsocephalus gunnari TaxID=52237 RepID=A0AAN8CQF4_CHAGU|nr:hypothetical protein CgunFtcFv8_016197 [Champsocephalus gunnari]